MSLTRSCLTCRHIRPQEIDAHTHMCEHLDKMVNGSEATRCEDYERDDVNHPAHYTAHPSGVECIQITRHMGFNLGNALKYIWRCDLKRDAVEDLRKAVFYLEDEIERRGSNL